MYWLPKTLWHLPKWPERSYPSVPPARAAPDWASAAAAVPVGAGSPSRNAPAAASSGITSTADSRAADRLHSPQRLGERKQLDTMPIQQVIISHSGPPFRFKALKG